MMLAHLVEAAVRSMALGAIVWIVLRAFRIRTLQTRSFAWTAVLLTALTMPLLTQAVAAAMTKAPPSTVEWLRASTSPLFLRPPLAPAAPSVQSTSSMDWALPASIVYLLVAAAFCLRVLGGLLRSRQLWKAAVPLREPWASGCDVRVSPELTIPVTFGATILLPADWPQWSAFKRNAVFLHEKCHVRRRDFYIHLLASLHRAVFWFSPFAWWLQNHLLELAEANCDDEAIRKVEDRVSYAEVLVELAGKRSRSGFVGVAMASGKTVELRVERILREAGIAPETSLFRRLLIVAMLMPVAVLAASLWQVQAEAVPLPLPLALTLPHQNPQVPQSVPVPAQPVPTASPQAAGPPQATQYLARWVDQEVPDIATVEEQNGFQALRTDEEREKFIESFWLRRDPTPGTADNEYRDEYYRRIVDANQRFTTPSGIPGWETDRGRVLFKHGEPDTRVTATRVSLRMDDGSVISLGPVELWRYRYIEGIGNNVELLFVDTARDGNYRLELDPKQRDLIIKAIP